MAWNRDQSRHRLFGRRVALLAGLQGVLFTALAARLYKLQIVESERYALLAEENRINLRLVPPVRGRVLDRAGEVLAYNELSYRVMVVPEQTGSVPETLEVLSTLIPIGEGDQRRVLREAARKRRFLPISIRDNLSWEEMAKIAINAPDLPGVIIDSGSTRHYPHAETTSHLVGYVAPPAEADLTGDPLLELPDFRIGRAGVERSYDLALRGRAGTSQIEVNAVGRPIRELARTEGEAGRDLSLTLDLALQRFSVDRLAKEESAAAVVMDVNSGALLAMASVPSYDANDFTKGIAGATWRALIGNPRGPLTNKAIAGQYAPGSTFKMMVALAGLEAAAVTPDTRVYCPGHMELGDNRFHCWKRGGHGSMDMVEALRHSCDVYFYEVARRVGIDRIAAMSRRFGMGRPVGLDLPNERPGLMPTREWKQATQGITWQQGETLVAGIGQGYVLTTPLQLAVMTARLVNGGTAVVPHLTRDQIVNGRLAPRPPPRFPGLGIPAQHLAVVGRGMNEVVNSQSGTAYKARITEAGLAMGGKTGTSQVRRITEEERRTGVRRNDQIPWAHRDHALFVGFAPVHAPRFACACIVEHGGGGSAVAAPIVRDILLETQRRFQEDTPDGARRVADTPPPPRRQGSGT